MKYIFTLAFILSQLVLIAQSDDKFTIAVLPFKHDLSGKGFSEVKVKKDRGLILNALTWLDDNTTSVLAYPERKVPEQRKESILKDLHDQTTRALMKDKRLNIYERLDWDLLETEKELQKNEDFIDGEIVEQSKSIGAEYIIVGGLSKDMNSLSLSLLKVSDQSLIAKSNFDIVLLQKGVQQLIRKAFPLSLKVLRISDKNTSEKDGIIIFGGTNIGLPKRTKLLVNIVTKISVNHKTLAREEAIGVLSVRKHINKNFTVCKVKSGNSKIKKALKKGEQLYCRVLD